MNDDKSKTEEEEALEISLACLTAMERLGHGDVFLEEKLEMKIQQLHQLLPGNKKKNPKVCYKLAKPRLLEKGWMKEEAGLIYPNYAKLRERRIEQEGGAVELKNDSDGTLRNS